METFKGVSLQEFPYKGLKKFEDLIYYDGPLLSHFVDEADNNFLFYWLDYGDDFNRWMVADITKTHLYEYLAGQRSLLSVFNCEYNKRVVTVDIDEEINYHNCLFVQFSDIPLEYLPTEDSVYTLSIPIAYDELFKELSSEHRYVMALREKAVFFKLDSLENSFGKTLGVDDVNNFLSKLTRSFLNYVDARFKNIFRHKYLTEEALTKAANKFLELVTPRVVNLKYNSFGVELASDVLEREGVLFDAVTWQQTILEEYKKDVIDFDYSSYANLSQNLKALEPEQVRSIFQPIIQLSNNPNFNIQVSDDRKGHIKTISRVPKKIELTLFPKPQIEETQAEMEFANLIMELEKGTDISKLTPNKILKAMLSVGRNSQTTLPLEKFDIEEGETIRFQIPLDYTLSVKEGGFYEVKYEPLDIDLFAADRTLAIDEFVKSIKRLYLHLIKYPPERPTQKEKAQMEHLKDMLY